SVSPSTSRSISFMRRAWSTAQSMHSDSVVVANQNGSEVSRANKPQSSTNSTKMSAPSRSRSACGSSECCMSATSACGQKRILNATLHLAMVNQMVQCSSNHLDASFAALSDATRRGVLDQLGRADASISDLAAAFNMTLTGMRKHVGVLERA